MARPQAHIGSVITVKNKPKKGKPASINAAPVYHVCWVLFGGKPVQLMMTDSDITKVSKRAADNPEDGIHLVPKECSECVARQNRPWWKFW